MKTTQLIYGDKNGLRDVEKKDRRRSTASFNSDFGKALKDRRRALGLKQTELALKIGIHPITLSRIETGSVRVSSKMQNHINHILDELV